MSKVYRDGKEVSQRVLEETGVKAGDVIDHQPMFGEFYQEVVTEGGRWMGIKVSQNRAWKDEPIKPVELIIHSFNGTLDEAAEFAKRVLEAVEIAREREAEQMLQDAESRVDELKAAVLDAIEGHKPEAGMTFANQDKELQERAGLTEFEFCYALRRLQQGGVIHQTLTGYVKTAK